MPPNQSLEALESLDDAIINQYNNNNNNDSSDIIRCAILGCGMMGQEHISYISGYPNNLRIDFLCDPHQPSLDKSLKIFNEFNNNNNSNNHTPTLLTSEDELLLRISSIDLLVIASPNYLHTPSLLRWGQHPITILLEKPVAVSRAQHDQLLQFSHQDNFRARVWVAMEYRFIPAIAKLLSLKSRIGEIKMVTVRENRYPFLKKIGEWNRDKTKTGDTLVEKCCHFFDLFRLIVGREVVLEKMRSLAQRGLNYEEEGGYEEPIIDAAYVMMPFEGREEGGKGRGTMGCLELCMYAEGSRHQEEIIVTGTKGRLEAYLPENTVYHFHRPNLTQWNDRTIPPPPTSIQQTVHDCSNVKEIHGITTDMPTHGGYHYSSTAVEWYNLIEALKEWKREGEWRPMVSLEDGLRAVDMGLHATERIVNEEGGRRGEEIGW